MPLEKHVKGNEIEHIEEVKELAAEIILVLQRYCHRLGIEDTSLGLNHLTIAFSTCIIEVAGELRAPQPMPWRIRKVADQIARNALEIYRLRQARMN